MKHIKRLLAFSLTASCLINFSCSDKRIIEPKGSAVASNDAVGVGTAQSNYHVFASKEDFSSTMASLSAMTAAERKQWDSGNTVYSVAELYNSTDAAAIANESNPNSNVLGADSLITLGQMIDIPDPNLACALNRDGILQIGDTIYKVTKPYTYLYHPDQRTNILSGNSSGYFSYVENAGALSRDIDQCNVYWSRMFVQLTDNNGNELPRTGNGRKTRMATVIWNTKTIFYQSVGIRAKYQRDSRFAGWVQEDCDWIRVSGFVDVKDAYGNQIARSASSEASSTGNTDKEILAASINNFYNVNKYLVVGTAQYRGATAHRNQYCTNL